GAMDRSESDRNVEPLRRYWDGIARGSGADAEGLDPDVVDVVRRLRELAGSPSPDPAFAKRLREQLRALETAHRLPDRPVPIVPNGHAGSERREASDLPAARAFAHRRSTARWLPFAAVLVV